MYYVSRILKREFEARRSNRFTGRGGVGTMPPANSARGGSRMKAMWIGFGDAIAIAVLVGVVMYNINPGSDETYSVS